MSIIAKYKFDSSIYADLIPEFNAEFTNYNITDEVDSENSNHIIRTIECDTLPTLMRFGSMTESGASNGANSLLELLYADAQNLTDMTGFIRLCGNLTQANIVNVTSNVNNMYTMCQHCHYLTQLDVSTWDVSNVTDMRYMFGNCQLITSLDVSNWDTSKVTNMKNMFQYCYNLTSLDVSNWDTSNVTEMNSMFDGCSSLTSLDVSNFNTSEVSNMYAIFYGCNNLTTLDVSKWNTSNVNSMGVMFTHCNNLTSLDVSNWDTSNVNSMQGMFYKCSKLTTLDVSKWNTSQVTDMKNMFFDCKSLTSLDVSNFDTSNVVDMYCMFHNCQLITSLDVSKWNTSQVTDMQHTFDMCYALNVDVSNWDTSNVTNMYAMFGDCRAMSSLDLSKWNTSKMTNMLGVFWGCTNLVELNISSWDTSKVTNMKKMFYDCTKLTTLDISNFNTSKVTDASEMFANTPLLTDIGMIYCNQSTIDKVASLLPTDTTQTIWVEDVDIKDLTPVEGVEFKQYAKNTEVMLTSPLLEGDKLVVKDGKTYHYHKMGMEVLNGSDDEDWEYQGDTNVNTGELIFNNVYRAAIPLSDIDYFIWDYLLSIDTTNYIISDKFISLNTTTENNLKDIEKILLGDYGRIMIDINKSRLSSNDKDSFKLYLQDNPVTVVYKLANPYYELISEDSLDISLIAESSDITNSSNIPLNMTINNKGLSTIAMSPSTTYTIAFDKDTDGEVVVNLCGNEVTTTDNIVEITTPSEIDDELIFYGDGVEVSNVRLLEGSMSGDSVPRESFEGLKSSFEDGYIPENALVDFPTDIYLNGSSYNEGNGDGYNVYYHTVSLKTNKVYTVFCNINEETTCTDGIGLRLVVEAGDKHYDIIAGDLTAMKGVFCSTFTLTNELREDKNLELWNRDTGIVSISNMVILEGDWTHLTEEDWNHLGKYKVEYKVTGKNKFDCRVLENGGVDITTGLPQSNTIRVRTPYIKIKKGTYTCSRKDGDLKFRNLLFYDNNKKYVGYNYYENPMIIPYDGYLVAVFSHEDGVSNIDISTFVNDTEIMIEEGSTATPYEPYKECIKTFYLNSPLLEGDTIEDVNGVATHVKRYSKVVLDGSESWESYYNAGVRLLVPEVKIYGDTNTIPNMYCDNLPVLALTPLTQAQHGISIGVSTNITLYVQNITSFDNIKQWLSENPTTVVYKLASPILEPISTEPILCDSYVNGHLDVDTNVPIEKVEFYAKSIALKYVQPNTKYSIQFESDNIGVITEYGVSATIKSNIPVHKGINKLTFTTLNDITYYYVFLEGIGFNASNIQVVATDRNADFGYFKGLQSSFENNMENLWDGTLVKGEYISTNCTYIKDASKARSVCIKCRPNTTYIITATNNDRLRIGHVSELVDGMPCMIYDIDDTNIRYKEFTTTHREGYLIVYVATESNTNENITVDIREKANKVKCKVVGKNKFDGEIIQGAWNTDAEFVNASIYVCTKNRIKVKPNTNYMISGNLTLTSSVVFIGKNGEHLGLKNYHYTQYFTTPNNCEYIKVDWHRSTGVKPNEFTNLQIEEGTQATEYEPYKEYTKTIYLNSPLLKGDKIEVHNGKLCHYHKMGKVVLDGSEDEVYTHYKESDTYISFVYATQIMLKEKTGISNNFRESSNNVYNICDEGIWTNGTTNYLYMSISKNKLTSSTAEGFKQWLSGNPTTVVYELAEPYYEEITPIQEDLIITSVKEGDLHIDTIVPISSKVTYNVNVQLLTDFEQSIVEQVQATQTTDLQSILDEEIDN